ncbi:S-locus lectin protein kinase family protein [Hibiscus syriacus]|uniref:S-locus lectin protein kinase family protein n=1 Tax=Hibiscus syriacus TaxID=106335 RepID=A0A6A2XXB2_HIBSY|nr:S-locus lectin protein kinase family protein [Hibiscus syriacus]
MEVERVQALAFITGGLKELPAKFICPPHERPENSKPLEGVTVPVVSLMLPHGVLIERVFEACTQWGYFLAKEAYANDPSTGKFEGYVTKMTKNLDEKVEWVDSFFHHISPPSKVNLDVWPKHPPSYREVNEEYSKEMLRITGQLLELLSEGLKLDKKALATPLGDQEIELEIKINMYPPCPQPHLALGVESHTDMSALTLLLPNEIPGLQVSKDGHWVAVDYSPDALFVHVGDQIEVLSNAKYKSVVHRSVVSKDRTRMSWAMFSVPPHEAVIGPLPELVDEKNPAKYSTKIFAEYQYQYRKFNKLPQ